MDSVLGGGRPPGAAIWAMALHGAVVIGWYDRRQDRGGSDAKTMRRSCRAPSSLQVSEWSRAIGLESVRATTSARRGAAVDLMRSDRDGPAAFRLPAFSCESMISTGSTSPDVRAIARLVADANGHDRGRHCPSRIVTHFLTRTTAVAAGRGSRHQSGQASERQ